MKDRPIAFGFRVWKSKENYFTLDVLEAVPSHGNNKSSRVPFPGCFGANRRPEGLILQSNRGTPT